MQNGRGEGSLSIFEKEKGRPAAEIIKEWSHMPGIEWLVDDRELSKIADVFLQIPFEYGFNGITGKNYHAIKDFCEWNGLDKGIHVPMILEMATHWVIGLNEKAKEKERQ